MAELKQPVEVWRYYLPSGNDAEWAEIVIVSTGMFAAVSDWGNYAFAWRSPGDEGIKAFLARDRGEHWDYFTGKLSQGHRLCVKSYPRDCEQFCKRILPRLAAVLREELRAGSGESAVDAARMVMASHGSGACEKDPANPTCSLASDEVT
jgi:hypothetical protein